MVKTTDKSPFKNVHFQTEDGALLKQLVYYLPSMREDQGLVLRTT